MSLKTHKKFYFSLLAIAVFLLSPNMAFSQSTELPTKPVVIAGDVYFEDIAPGVRNIISKTDYSIVNWDTYNISPDGTLNYIQPSSSSVFLNRVIGGDPSVIAGALNSNGNVFVVNSNGVFFTSTARVDVNGLVVSTLDITNEDFLNGNYKFFNNGGNGYILNQGNIIVKNGGYVALLSQAVENQGLIQADLGSVALASGDKMTLALDDLNQISVVIDEAVKAPVIGPDGKITDAIKNSGSILANGGKVILTAEVLNNVFDYAINNTGIIQANTLVSKNGEIELTASGAPIINSGTLTANKISISDPDSGFYNKGKITADGTVDFINGGIINIYAWTVLQAGLVSANAFEGGRAGEISIVSEISTVLDGGSNTQAMAQQDSREGYGGRIYVNSRSGNTYVDKNARINVSAGSVKGDAGVVEISAFDQIGFFGILSSRAPPGYKHGKLILDPAVINGEINLFDADLIINEIDGIIINANITVTNGEIIINADCDGDGIGDLVLSLGKTIQTLTSGNVQLAGAHVKLLGTVNSAGNLTVTGIPVNFPGHNSINSLLSAIGTVNGAITLNIAGAAYRETVNINRAANIVFLGDISMFGLTTVSGADIVSQGNLTINGNVSLFSKLDIGANTLTIAGDSIDFLGGAGSVSGAGGRVILQPSRNNVSIGIGNGAVGTLLLDSTDLAALADGFNSIIIGHPLGMHVIDIREVTFLDPVTIRTPRGGSITVNGRISGNSDASITLDGSRATTILNANIITSGNAISIIGNVILGAPALITLDTTAGGLFSAGSDISITGTINDDLTASGLVLNAGTGGDLTLGGVIGGTQAVASLDFDALNVILTGIGTAGSAGVTGDTDINALNQLIFTGMTYNANQQNYTAGAGSNFLINRGFPTTFTSSGDAIIFNTADLLLSNGSNLIINSNGGAISLQSIRGNSSEDVTLNAGTGTVRVGKIGNADEINTVIITAAGGITLYGDIITSSRVGNSVTITGPVTLAADITIDTKASGIFGKIQFVGSDSTIDGPYSLTLDAGNSAVVILEGAVGANSPLTRLVINGRIITISNIGKALREGVSGDTNVTAARLINFIGTIYHANQQVYNTPRVNIISAAPTTFTSSGDAISFPNNGTINLSDGSDLSIYSNGGAITLGRIRGNSSEDVTIDAGTGTVYTGAIGNADEINTVLINAATITLNGNIITSNALGNSVTLNGDVLLDSNITIDTNAAANCGMVKISGRVNSVASETNSLVIDAGSSDVILGNEIGAIQRLKSLLITALNISLNGSIYTEGGNVVMQGPLGTPANILLNRPMVIDTEEGNDSAAGRVTLANTNVFSASRGIDLLIDTTGGFDGNVSLGEFSDNGGLDYFVNDLTVNKGGAALTLNKNICLDDDGAGDTGDFVVPGGGSIVISDNITVDTEQGNDANGGLVDWGLAVVYADAVGYSLTIDTSTSCPAADAGAISLGTVDRGYPGAYLDNLTLLANGTNRGGLITLNGDVRTINTVNISNNGLVDIVLKHNIRSATVNITIGGNIFDDGLETTRITADNINLKSLNGSIGSFDKDDPDNTIKNALDVDLGRGILTATAPGNIYISEVNGGVNTSKYQLDATGLNSMVVLANLSRSILVDALINTDDSLLLWAKEFIIINNDIILTGLNDILTLIAERSIVQNADLLTNIGDISILADYDSNGDGNYILNAGKSVVTNGDSNYGKILIRAADVIINTSNPDTLIDAKDNKVIIEPSVSGRAINLGIATLAGTLNLSDAELDRMSAKSIVIGNSTSGDISINSNINPARTSILSLISGGRIIENGTAAITIEQLVLRALKDISLNNNNNVGTLAALISGSGNFEFKNINSLVIGSIDGIGIIVPAGFLIKLDVGGAIIDGNSGGADLSSTDLILIAASGIGSAENSIETAVSNLKVSNGSNDIWIINEGDLNLTNFGTGNAVSNGDGDVNITTNSTLSISAPVEVGGDITFTADDNGGDDDNIIVFSDVRSTTGGGIRFN
ncbi:MAG: filamentous hemagglutinin N-terminal domain-containing protein, partial [Candidatus Omnitrophota bacterium]